MRIIPAIDIIDGKCVRLTKGDYNTKIVYNEQPLEVAKMFEAHGITSLHLVDLDGAKSKTGEVYDLESYKRAINPRRGGQPILVGKLIKDDKTDKLSFQRI